MPYATPFVTEVAPDAKSLVYSTYLDYAYVVTVLAVLPDGSALVYATVIGDASYSISDWPSIQAMATSGWQERLQIPHSRSSHLYSQQSRRRLSGW